jgi:hypothetical protein
MSKLRSSAQANSTTEGDTEAKISPMRKHEVQGVHTTPKTTVPIWFEVVTLSAHSLPADDTKQVQGAPQYLPWKRGAWLRVFATMCARHDV